MRRAWAFALAGGALIGGAGCGSTSSSTIEGGGSTAVPTLTPGPATETSSTTAATTQATTSSTATGGPPAVGLLHVVASDSGVALPGTTGAGWRSVAMLPPDSHVMDVAHGEVLAVTQTSTVNAAVVVDLSSGADHTVATGVFGFGGAISPDGTQIAYVAPRSSGGFELRVATIAGGSSHALASYGTGPVPAPLKWGSDGILADLIVPNSDAPSQGVTRIDASNGHELARSAGVGQHGVVACGDGDHVLAVDHTSGLGDDGDVQPGPGAQGNGNTLRVVTVGGPQTVVKQAAHHQIQPFACPSDGGIAAFQDLPSAGAFAGISQSPDFGLFLAHGGATTQLDHYGTTYDGAAVYQDGASIAADKSESSSSTVVELGPSHPFGGDTAPGTGGSVDLVFFG